MDKLLQVMQIRYDWALHALYGLLLYNILLLTGTAAMLAALVVVLVGLLKEIYDYRNDNHTAEALDTIATSILPLLLAIVQLMRG